MNNSKTKILFTIGDFGVGGKERQLIEVLKVIDEELFEMTLVAKKLNAHYISNIPKSIKIIDLNRNKFGISSWFIFYKILRKNKPDIVHSWATPTSFIFAIYKYILPISKFKLIDGSIRQAHNNSKKLSYYSLQRQIIKIKSDLIISNSKAGLQSYNIKKKGIVIYNGFDLNRIQHIKPVEKKENIFVIGMVARFDPIKDYPTYIKSALKIIAIRKDVHFYAIGSGSILSEIKSIIPAEKQAFFTFTGSVSDVENYVSQFDIAILASHSEGISNSILEYMSLSKPIIASGTGGTNEIITHGKNGFLVQSLDVNSMVTHILNLLDNSELRFQMGNAAYHTLCENFSINSMKNKFEKNYLNLIK